VASKPSDVSDAQGDIGDEQKQAELNNALRELVEEVAANDQADW
jgi:hypothetical protein